MKKFHSKYFTSAQGCPAKMLRVVATPVAGMLTLQYLATNEVTDVATFPASSGFWSSQRIICLAHDFPG